MTYPVRKRYIRRIHLREKTLLTKRNLAFYFHVHQDTIGRWMKWGYLLKPEDKLLYPESNVFLWKLYKVNAWLRENCQYGKIELTDEGEMVDSLLSIKQAAYLWNVSPAFIIKWYYYENAELPYLKIGFTIRLERESLKEFMKERAKNRWHIIQLYSGRKLRAERKRAREEKEMERLRKFERRILGERDELYGDRERIVMV